jgi:hypothetical protein
MRMRVGGLSEFEPVMVVILAVGGVEANVSVKAAA